MLTQLTARGYIALIASLSLVQATAAPPAFLGTVNAWGNVRVDGASVSGNATVFEGSVIETDGATGVVRLQKGVQLTLNTASRARVFAGRAVLEQGASEISASSAYTLEAGKFRIVPDTDSRAVVRYKSDRVFDVATLSGAVRVTDGSGLMLARINAGRAITFSTQAAGAAAPIRVTGMISNENGRYFIIAKDSGVKYEIVGSNVGRLDMWAGTSATITGTLDPKAVPAAGASAVIILAGDRDPAAIVMPGGAGSSGGSGTAGAATGMSAATKALIGGFIVAAAAGTGYGIRRAVQNESPASR